MVKTSHSRNQSGYEPLNLKNGSFVNSDMTYNFAATDFRLYSED